MLVSLVAARGNSEKDYTAVVKKVAPHPQEKQGRSLSVLNKITTPGWNAMGGGPLLVSSIPGVV